MPPHNAPEKEKVDPNYKYCFCISNVVYLEIVSLLTLLVSAYSVVIGASFAVFVPQACGHTAGSGANATRYEAECTFEENTYIQIDAFNALVLGVNFVSVLLLLGGFGFELVRERFIITNFAVDLEVSDDNLEMALMSTGRTELMQNLHWYNSRYMWIFSFLLVFNIVNVALSAVLIRQWYAGYRSITTFITNFIILFSRLGRSIMLARTCILENQAQSANIMQYLTFNVVHGDPPASPPGGPPHPSKLAGHVPGPGGMPDYGGGAHGAYGPYAGGGYGAGSAPAYGAYGGAQQGMPGGAYPGAPPVGTPRSSGSQRGSYGWGCVALLSRYPRHSLPSPPPHCLSPAPHSRSPNAAPFAFSPAACTTTRATRASGARRCELPCSGRGRRAASAALPAPRFILSYITSFSSSP